jgi:methylaspartate mutase epsilon subunit
MKSLLDAGAHFLPITIDSHSRLCDFGMAEAMLRLSLQSDKNLMNGFPLVAHGWKDVRWLIDQFDCPVSLRHGSPEPRQLVETAIAAGITDIEGGAISYVLPYSVKANLKHAFKAWSHVDACVGWYAKEGVFLNRESFGPLSATLVPPVVIISVQLIELLLASVHGVKSFTVTVPELPSQDQTFLVKETLVKIIKELKTSNVLSEDIHISIGLHQWMGVFPNDEELADALILNSASFANLLGVDKLITKTKMEHRGVPSLEVNALAVRKCSFVLKNKSSCMWVENGEVDQLRLEVLNILKNFINIIKKKSRDVKQCVELLNEELELLVVKGWIDIPFAPHRENKNELIGLLDSELHIRIYSPGSLPLSEDYIQSERDALSKRVKDQPLSELISRDIFIKCS